MTAHGTDLQSFSAQPATCPCTGDPSQSRSCINLKIALNNGKKHEYNLFGDETISEQQIDIYLNSEFNKIKGTAHIFKIVIEAHPGYIEFTFAGKSKRLSGEQV